LLSSSNTSVIASKIPRCEFNLPVNTNRIVAHGLFVRADSNMRGRTQMAKATVKAKSTKRTAKPAARKPAAHKATAARKTAARKPAAKAVKKPAVRRARRAA
jgi:hypothetical protein